MKICAEIDLEDIYVGHGIEESVAGIVRDEIRKAIQSAIKDQIKARKGKLQQRAAEMVDEMLGGTKITTSGELDIIPKENQD